MALGNKVAAEFVGTFWLVFGGCGSAILAAAFPELGIGFLGVALAFGLTVLTMAYAIGHISGCHLNPTVSVGLLVGKRFPTSEVVPYLIAQVLGGLTLIHLIGIPVDNLSVNPARSTGTALFADAWALQSIRRQRKRPPLESAPPNLPASDGVAEKPLPPSARATSRPSESESARSDPWVSP